MKAIALFGGSGGLGSAVAKRLGRDHAVMVGYFRQAAKAEQVAAEIRAAGGTAAARAVDVRDFASVKAFLEASAALSGGLGGVASMSGAPFPMCALTDASEKEFRDVIETELFGTFNILKATAPMLKEAGGGAILLFLTTAVLRTMDYDGLNSVPKAAMAMMLRHVAREAGPDNVRINAIAPGVIDAGRTEIVDQLGPLVQKVVSDCLRDTPLPRLGKPEEVAALAAYLLSADSGYVNGQIIGLDGGYSA